MSGHLRKFWPTYALSLSIALVAVWVIGWSDAFHECINKSYYESADREPEKGVAFLLSWIDWRKDCTGAFLKENGEAITAFFTIVLAVSTIGLWLFTRRLWASTSSAVTLANKEFVASHRPKILVRGVANLEPFQVGERVKITLSIVNTGDTDATVIELAAGVIVGSDNLRELSKKVQTIPVTQRKLMSGQFGVAEFLSRDPLSAAEADQLRLGDTSIYCVGHVRYEDDLKIPRITGFLRKHVGRGNRFAVPKDPDPEYEYAY